MNVLMTRFVSGDLHLYIPASLRLRDLNSTLLRAGKNIRSENCNSTSSMESFMYLYHSTNCVPLEMGQERTCLFSVLISSVTLTHSTKRRKNITININIGTSTNCSSPSPITISICQEFSFHLMAVLTSSFRSPHSCFCIQ